MRRQPRGLTPIRKGRAALASINPAMAQSLEPTLSKGRWLLGRVREHCGIEVDVGKSSSCLRLLRELGGTGCFLSLGYHGYLSLLLLRDTPPSHTPVHHYCRIMAAEECYRTRWAYQTTPVRSRPLPSPSQPSCHRCGVGEPPQASSRAQRPFFIVLQLSCACRIVGNHQQFGFGTLLG
jgi:hypothetical protein